MPVEKTALQTAIDEFDAADALFRERQELFSTGRIMAAIWEGRPGMTVEKATQEYQYAWEEMKKFMEDRNAKLKSVKDALRQSVMMSQTQWRGHAGKATTLSVGRFNVSSRTKRWIDTECLVRLLTREGKLAEALALTKVTSEGKTIKVLEPAWKVDYESMVDYLVANNLLNVLKGSYEEEESTPQVTGPKAVTLFKEEA
jgi:hypothetical protein